MFLTYANSIRAPFVALPILRLSDLFFTTDCVQFSFVALIFLPIYHYVYLKKIVHFNVDFSVYNSNIDNRSLYVIFLALLHVWKSW
jgi:hypothetical protein